MYISLCKQDSAELKNWLIEYLATSEGRVAHPDAQRCVLQFSKSEVNYISASSKIVPTHKSVYISGTMKTFQIDI